MPDDERANLQRELIEVYRYIGELESTAKAHEQRMDRQFGDIVSAIRDTREAVERLSEQYSTKQELSAGRRVTLAAAVIAGSFAVLVALISLVGVLIERT